MITTAASMAAASGVDWVTRRRARKRRSGGARSTILTGKRSSETGGPTPNAHHDRMAEEIFMA
ncbi:hypothetical protein AB8Y43_15290, partial [Listeria monocytogenes]